ncbi:hypothetical protein P8843_07095 [Bacillus inaquosorum]|uniref:hypothetical protein n=1 Tax=Bacillus inaquosorum TaxID=483913 RepID=UPI0022813A28|nr:hypothetical protein [Bacillus inaquosorum]MCY7977441.1 hypothetical protein [Bacillus inaquosorum]MEC0589994.1 hypothetical protein [Bacillus inaquosorum]
MNLFNLTHVGIIHNKAINYINSTFPGLLDKVEYTLEDKIGTVVLDKTEEHVDSEFQVLGAYCPESRTIFLCRRSTLKAAIHELGHAVHHQLLNYKTYKLSQEGKSERAEYNYKEDFAEAFAELVLRQDNDNFTKRDMDIRTILQGV